MRRPILVSAAAALAVAALAGSGSSNLDAVRLGKLVAGPSLTIPQCKGNVLLLEFWGTH